MDLCDNYRSVVLHFYSFLTKNISSYSVLVLPIIFSSSSSSRELRHFNFRSRFRSRSRIYHWIKGAIRLYKNGHYVIIVTVVKSL